MAKKKASTPVVKRTKPDSGPPYVWVSGFFRKHWPALIILAALAIIPYWQSLNYEYVLDDQIVISKNNYTKEGLSGIWDILSSESMEGYFGEQKDLVAGARYRPLSIVTFAIEYSLMPDNPWIGHLGNILFYALTCLLLYRILVLLFPLAASRQWWWSIPFVAGVMYVLHPVHTEVVANIKGRDEILVFLGALGSVWLTLRYLSDKRNLWLILSGFSFFMALLSKENAITFLAVIPAVLWFFTAAKKEDYIRTFVPILSATVIYLLIRYNVIGYFLSSGKEITDLMNNPFVDMRMDEKLATIVYTLGLYLKLLIYPHPLTHDYYPYAIPIMNWGKWQVWLSLAAYAGMIVLFFRGYKKKTVPAFAVFFFLATISIVSNLVFPVGTFMNERFIFISSVAFVMVLSWILVEKLPEWLPGKIGLPLGLLVAGAIVIGYGMKTWNRVPVWENALTLNSAAIKVSPNSARANTFMATALYQKYRATEDPEEQKKILGDMGIYIRRAVDIYPSYFSGLTMYVGILSEEFRFDNDIDKLLAGFRRVFENRDYLQFVDQYMDFLDKQPQYQTKVLEFYYQVGYQIFWQRRRNKQYAIKYLQRGLNLQPGNQILQAAMDEVRRG
ncbi:MAG: glycosyltransferase family 39 protein [Saprospiraceae bacterium]|nr:glycosyltransferase family 39 protein [Saprospiraceae bacterium]